MAALMLPSAVLTHLKAGVRAALGPEPIFDGLVRTPSIGNATETLQAIADDRAVRVEAALREP